MDTCCLGEMLLLSTHMFQWRNKKYININPYNSTCMFTVYIKKYRDLPSKFKSWMKMIMMMMMMMTLDYGMMMMTLDFQHN